MEIEGFENYLIYPDGKVYNKKTESFMKITNCKGKNSQIVNLSNNGKQKAFTVKTLVARYYIPPGGIHIRGDPKYLIYKEGVIWSISKGDYIKLQVNKDGYQWANLFINGKKWCCRIHRCIAEHFLTNPNNLPQVDHKDRNKLNNHLDNLRYVSKENNARNKGMQKNNTSGYTGIHKNEWGNWKAIYNYETKKSRSKTFKTLEEAIAWRKKMVDKHYNRPDLNSQN